MQLQVERRIADQKAEDLVRLADQAEREGVTIYVTADGEHLASSRSNPTLLHRVDRRGCDCKGYSYWQRCGHHALLLSQLGEIPDVGEDELVALCWQGVDLEPAPAVRPLARQYVFHGTPAA